MSEGPPTHDESAAKERMGFQRILLALGGVVLAGVVFYFFKVPQNVQYWGPAGDSVAPFTALLTAATLLAALWSIALQRQETREARHDQERTALAQERAAAAQERLVDFELHKVRDAAAQVRDLATALSEATLSVLASEGMFTSALTEGYKLMLRNKVVGVLQHLEVNEAAVARVTETIDLVMRQRHVVRVLTAVREYFPDARDLHKEFDALISLNSVGTSESVAAVLRKHSVANSNVLELLADLEHFERTKQFRRPQLWDGAGEE